MAATLRTPLCITDISSHALKAINWLPPCSIHYGIQAGVKTLYTSRNEDALLVMYGARVSWNWPLSNFRKHFFFVHNLVILNLRDSVWGQRRPGHFRILGEGRCVHLEKHVWNYM
jgi:hypothetical protein